MKNSYNKAKIYVIGEQTKGESCIGGIIGISHINEILNCYNYGEIIGDVYGVRIGGILGQQYANVRIDNVFNIRQNNK